MRYIDRTVRYSSLPIGVMAAQGMLNNPAMYAGYDITPRQCVEDWVREIEFDMRSIFIS